MPNRLINETSPYLLQHANNPVDWYPWGDEAFEKAKQENKLVLVSIGYSACHWCHVMEHESFEDAEVAKLMNTHFVCIKVDREERPDVDQVYMDAVQLMAGRGGWPLNCFALPDARPVYGGTYFPKENWMELLMRLNEIYHTDKPKVLEFADELEKGIIRMSAMPDFKEAAPVDFRFLENMVAKMQTAFDNVNGGYGGAPKFPMPNIYEFLLYYAYVLRNTNRAEEAKDIEAHIYKTLDKMALGGIYDVLEGGFARYSTDSFWKAPHFEKMLYDNGQLMSLYSNAFKCNAKRLYKETVYGIYSFVTKSLMSSEGGFYSALDADSEGKEGEYYVWKKDELQFLLTDEFPLFAQYFGITDKDVWEDGKFILHRKLDDEDFCTAQKITPMEFEQMRKRWADILTPYRKKRIAPGLDDKTLASWNGLMLKGLVDAYNTFGDISFLDTAIKNAKFISEKLMQADGSLWRNYKNGKATIPAFLEDYAFVADALFALYQCTFEEQWLQKAEKLVEHSLKHFYDKDKNTFYFTANYHKAVITRKVELSDNVIPASTSAMANLLCNLGHCLGKEEYINITKGMLGAMKGNMQSYPNGYTNWGVLGLKLSNNFYEVAVTGSDVDKLAATINKCYLPNKIMLGAQSESKLELLQGKFNGNKSSIFVCENKTCFAPVYTAEEAITNIERVK